MKCGICQERDAVSGYLCPDCVKRINDGIQRGQRGRSTSRPEERQRDSIFGKLYDHIAPPYSTGFMGADFAAGADWSAFQAQYQNPPPQSDIDWDAVRSSYRPPPNASWESTARPGTGQEAAEARLREEMRNARDRWEKGKWDGPNDAPDTGSAAEKLKRAASANGAPKVLLICPRDSRSLEIDPGTVDPRVPLLTVRCSCGYAAAIDRKTYLVTKKEAAAGIPSPNKLTTPAPSHQEQSTADRNRRRLRRLSAAFTFGG